MFLIVLYDFATAGKKQSTKHLLTLVLDVSITKLRLEVACNSVYMDIDIEIIDGGLIWETSWTVFKAFYHGTK